MLKDFPDLAMSAAALCKAIALQNQQWDGSRQTQAKANRATPIVPESVQAKAKAPPPGYGSPASIATPT